MHCSAMPILSVSYFFCVCFHILFYLHSAISGGLSGVGRGVHLVVSRLLSYIVPVIWLFICERTNDVSVTRRCLIAFCAAGVINLLLGMFLALCISWSEVDVHYKNRLQQRANRQKRRRKQEAAAVTSNNAAGIGPKHLIFGGGGAMNNMNAPNGTNPYAWESQVEHNGRGSTFCKIGCCALVCYPEIRRHASLISTSTVSSMRSVPSHSHSTSTNATTTSRTAVMSLLSIDWFDHVFFICACIL